jgi:enoyl-[acyl-carrier protein] reductase II
MGWMQSKLMSDKNAEAKLQALWQRGCDFLGSRIAILGGAMSWVSDRNLVSAISNAGGFGVIACGAMTPELLAVEIAETQARTDKPFGVNLITMHPDLDLLIDVCIMAKVTHVVLAGGVPSAGSIDKIKEAGIKTICFAPALALAKRMIRNGADALVIEGTEAGGHIGPVATSVLAQEILPHITDVPIFVAGGISRGEAIVSYLEMGASGCQLGTRFVCANESIAHPNFKKTFIRANARDAVPTVQIDPKFQVIPVRALVNEGTKRFSKAQREAAGRVERGEVELKDAQLEIEHFWAGALKRAVIDGDVENGSLMAGQSVGMVKAEQPTQDIINELVNQAVQFLGARGRK